ncbi:hypothetical protein EJ110_NYTH54477 [Nymphaea thermarum]|nr:hypothetical protein EJ110_NYTH54477 [Nymphaea thermarum]
MSAFKAANPDAVFEDFIRWHSPGDWESEVNDAAVSEKFDGSPRSEWPPKVFHEDDRDDFINNDLVRLCHAFHQVEQLLIFAASIHRKLLHAPRLCQGVFDDYYKFYSRRMGTSSVEISNDEEFHVKKSVRMHERDTVSDLFRPPTANQSWRKVLMRALTYAAYEIVLLELL